MSRYSSSNSRTQHSIPTCVVAIPGQYHSRSLRPIHRGDETLKFAALFITILLLAGSLFHPLYLREQSLQHAPTVIALVVLAADSRRNWLSRPSFLCVVFFIWLHILGARYIYSFVPYDDWANALTGSTISDWFGWERNHYDRLVHLLFGVLIVLPSAECGERHGKLSWNWSLGFAVLVVLAISALYEVFEWLLTVVMAPRHAEAYNGQQGDIWDAQKDMALAFGGSIVSSILLLILRSRKAPNP